MKLWAKSGFLENVPVNPNIEIDDFVGTIKVQLDSDVAANSSAITLSQDEKAKNIFSGSFKTKKNLTTVSGRISIFDPSGYVVQESPFESTVGSDGTISIKSEFIIEN